MTINSIIPLSHEDEMRSIEAHLKDFLYSWKGATTIEERERIEGLAIDTTLRLLDSAFEFSEISVGESLNDQRVLSESQEWKRHFDHLRNKFDSLSERYVSYFNRRQIKLLELYSSLKRIRQKKASLDIQGESLVGVAEKFLTWDNLSTRHTTGTPCAIETAQGVMTLPVESVVDIKVSGVTIGGKSNGRPGNSDIEVRADLSNPKNMFDNSLNTWFEYERLDEGPLLLQLNIELAKEEIINNIVIVPVLFGLTKGFKIEDISFSSSGKETKNIKELTIAEDNFWQISGDKEEWSVTFLPVATKNITLSFRQSSYSVIEVAKINNRKADRKRYGIGIKELKLRQKQFSSNGVMGSLELPCQAGLYVAQPVVNAFPRNPSIWTMGLDSSVDSGVAWFNHGDVVNGTGKLLYLEGNGGTLTWRTSVSRLDNSFATLSSLISEPFKIKNIDSVLKSVSRFQSPAIFALKSKPQDGQVFVFQAQVGKRGDKFSPIFLGTGTGSKMAFNLPFSVLEYNIDPDDVKILVNKTEYSFNPDIGSLGLEEWSFSADHRQVVFSDDLPDRCKVEMYLEEERMLLEETSDGYIYKTNMLFDPDKDTIRISSFDRDSNRVMKVMPRDKKVINLGARNVEDDSFKLTSFNGTTYNGVSSRSLLASPGDYYLDAINGVLYLHTAFGDDETRVSFLHQRLHQLSKDDYEILYREARPIGVLIKDTIRSRDITENVKGNLQKRYVPGRISLYGVREDAFSVSTKVMTLSYDYVIKGSVVVSDDLIDGETSPEEVEYVDGKTEFLRLTPVTREETVAIEANGSGLVTFNLSAGALYYEGFMCEFSDSTVFVNRLGVAPTGGSSVGDYYVSPSGVVTIKIGIGQTLPAGIKIFYYFLNPDFTPDNKYSIDYKNGILHAYNELNTDATITYKASNYTMKYNICQEVDSFSYSPLTNTVTIKTENLSLINSLVKVIWEIPSNETPVAELRKYFSPIIDLIGYRFA